MAGLTKTFSPGQISQSRASFSASSSISSVRRYSWMHFTPNKIEKKHILEKYEWQKPHQSNLTGTDQAYYPNKNKDGAKKNIKAWKNCLKVNLIIFFYFFFFSFAFSQNKFGGTLNNIKILDKNKSKN